VSHKKSMAKRRKAEVLLTMLLASSIGNVGCLYRYHSAACKKRGAEYSARVEKLGRDARERLTIGTRKDAVIRFFEENGLPVTFTANEASGTIHVNGCAPSGCGSDDGIVGLRVKVDKDGTVIGEPVVGAMYTNCV
jgi:hypothetical protein